MPDKESERALIRDPEEIVQSRRLNSIFDIREEIRDARKQILMERYSNKGVTRFEALCGYRTLANNYLMELEPLLLKFEPGKELLNDKEFGEAIFLPDYREKKAADSRTTKYEVVHHDATTTTVGAEPQPVSVELTGLRCLWDVPDPVTLSIPVKQKKSYRHLAEEKELTFKDQFGVRTIDMLVRCMNRFLSDIGFELDPEENKDPHQI
jgi:hypothetical protein